MKKIYKSLLILSAIAISVTGCGKKEENKNVVVPPDFSVIEPNTDYADINGEESIEKEDNTIDKNTDSNINTDVPEGYYLDTDGYLVREELESVVDESGNVYIKDRKITDGFRGKLVKDYSKEEEYVATNKVLISGSEYTDQVDLDISVLDWVSTYESMLSNPDEYIGKTIRLPGKHYTDGDKHIISLSEGYLIHFMADTYPTNGIPIEVTGTLYFNESEESFWIDSETVYRIE